MEGGAPQPKNRFQLFSTALAASPRQAFDRPIAALFSPAASALGQPPSA
jgi:hypothetical protein